MHLNLRRTAPFIVVIILAAVAFWFFWGEDGQQENGPLSASGTIEANQVVLASEIGGKVTGVLATEGELVRADDALVNFDDKLLIAQLDQAQTALVQAQANYNLVAKGFPEEQRQLAVTTAEMELLSTHFLNSISAGQKSCKCTYTV